MTEESMAPRRQHLDVGPLCNSNFHDTTSDSDTGSTSATGLGINMAMMLLLCRRWLY